ncbi:hypothetical protein ACHQM5_031081 [Ranunculus cassubicifolius]
MGPGIPGNSVLWFVIICIWPFFLGAHFVWAFSLMFLFSGRGYWQELIESIVWAHNKLKVAPAIQPRAFEYCTRTCCRSNPLPSGWNCHNVGVLLSKNYCSRIMARRI